MALGLLNGGLLQDSWLLITTISRVAQGYAVAPVEMTACLHFMVALSTYILQWHKPVDISVPMTISTPMSIDDALTNKLKALAGLEPQASLQDRKTIATMDALRHCDLDRNTGRFSFISFYILASTITARAVQIACTNAVFEGGSGLAFQRLNIAALVFLLCIFLSPFALWWAKREEKTQPVFWLLFILLYAMVGVSSGAVGVAIGGSIGGTPSVYYPQPWSDIIPHI